MPSVDELWLEVLQRLCDATAHDLKGALNGVALNVEVIRSRTVRPATDAQGLRQFAESAAAELETVIRSAEAMLVLARSPRDPPNIASITRSVLDLLARPAAGRGVEIVIEKSVERLASTTAPSAVVRLVIAATLLAAAESPGTVRCSADPDAAPAALRVIASERNGSRFALDDRIVPVARDAAVHLDITETGATITFPT